jgi:hypothetical protein
MRALYLAAALFAACALPAQAQAPKIDPAEARLLAAGYELTNADGTLKCPVTLDQKPAGTALALVFDRRACNQLFGFLNEVTGWAPGVAGAILFVGQGGRTIAEFTEGVGGVYEAIREGDAVYFLANLQFVDPSERVQIADLYGEWQISRPGGPAICRITLTDEVVGNELFTARLQPGCDPAIERLAPNAWQLERGDVVLRSKTGEALRFGRQEGGVWARVPDKPQPLLLSRP